MCYNRKSWLETQATCVFGANEILKKVVILLNVIGVKVISCPNGKNKEEILDKGVIKLDAENITNEEKEKLLTILHKHKHLFLDGFPHGKKTRRELKKKAGIVYEKWKDSPEVCITYYLTSTNDGLEIVSMIGNLDDAAKKYTQTELFHFMQLWQQDVIDEITAEFEP